MVRRLVPPGGPREEFSRFSLGWTPSFRAALWPSTDVSQRLGATLAKRCVLRGSEVPAMAGPPSNGLRFFRVAFTGAQKRLSSLEIQIEAWMTSEVKAISPLVDRLMQLIEGSHCVAGEEPEVELALHEALSNAVVHGNRMDTDKLVYIQCHCESGKGVSIVIRDLGQGFDPGSVPDPLSVESLRAEAGRGIHLMKLAMDEVSFEQGGTQVRMRKGPRKQKAIDEF